MDIHPNDLTTGDLVMVKNGGGDLYYVQRFVVYHNNLYFCERDDGNKKELVGWQHCIPNQGHKYYEWTSNEHYSTGE